MRKILWLVVMTAALALAGGASAEIRPHGGVATFTVPLLGPGGTGTAYLQLGAGGVVCYEISVTLITPHDFPREPAPGVGTAHIHVLPSGAIAVDLKTNFVPLGGGVFVASGCVHADPHVVQAILANPELYYVNVHTAAFPGGAVSGTLA